MRKNGGNGGSLDAPTESEREVSAENGQLKIEDEKRVEHRINHHGQNGEIHRLAGVTRGAQYGVQSKVSVRYDIAQQNKLHVVVSMG